MFSIGSRLSNSEEAVAGLCSSAEAFDHLLIEMRSIASRTARPSNEAAELYLLASQALGMMGYSRADILQIAEGMLLSFAEWRCSEQDAKTAINAYASAARRGDFDRDILNTMITRVPTLFPGDPAGHDLKSLNKHLMSKPQKRS